MTGSSRYYTLSGVKFTASLQGVNMETVPFDALLNGGIALATPEDEKMGIPTALGCHFPLVKTAVDGWLKGQPQLPPPAGSNQEKKVEKSEKKNS